MVFLAFSLMKKETQTKIEKYRAVFFTTCHQLLHFNLITWTHVKTSDKTNIEETGKQQQINKGKTNKKIYLFPL